MPKLATSAVHEVKLQDLYLDPNNFRLIHEPNQVNVPDDMVRDEDVASRTYRLLLGAKSQNIQDLVASFKTNGYLPVDQIQVREIQGGYLVVEGNRRVATLKYLHKGYEEHKIDLGNLDKSIFANVPVVFYEDTEEVHYLTLMGLKHISGNRKWGEWNQAKLLERLREHHGLPESEVCQRVGISTVLLRRNLRAIGLVNQYQASDYGDQFTESMFPIFREAVTKPEVRNWLEWSEQANAAQNPENRELFFSWLSQEPAESDSEDGASLSRQDDLEPAIYTRDDVRLLARILTDSAAIDKLTSGRNLADAYKASDLILNEKLDEAANSVASDIDTLGKLRIDSQQLPQLETALGKLRSIVERARSGDLHGVEQKAVFYDKIDQHFSSVEVVSYRRLQGLRVGKLARVNLFAGLNNSGKTSLLEAIYLLCKQNDFNGIVDVTRYRGKVAEDQLASQWFANQLTEAIAVKGVFDGQACTVEIKPFKEENSGIDQAHYLKSVDISTQFGTYKLESLTRVFQGSARETQADTIKLLANVVYSSPFFLNEPQHYTAFYHKSVQSKLLPQVIEFIRAEIVPEIKDIRLVDEFQRFLVDDASLAEAMDLASYGEGLQRIFFLSLLFASAQNGVLLIDEIENAIHTDLIDSFAKFLHALAKEFNVQAFLTSHSKECIDSFARNMPACSLGDFAFHAIVRDDDGKTSVPSLAMREYDGKHFHRLLSAGNVDLRRAR